MQTERTVRICEARKIICPHSILTFSKLLLLYFFQCLTNSYLKLNVYMFIRSRVRKLPVRQILGNYVRNYA